MTIEHLCSKCMIAGCAGNPCKPIRTRKARVPGAVTGKRQPPRLERDIAKYPAHIQAQIRAQL